MASVIRFDELYLRADIAELKSFLSNWVFCPWNPEVRNILPSTTLIVPTKAVEVLLTVR
jgi:hypothetical protein